MEKELHIYCDGACSGNPGPGGWGAVLIWGDKEKEISGAELNTTNNRMELRAAIEAIKSVKKKVKIVIHTDSQYVKNGITVWIKDWLRKNWNNGKVKNIELWKELLEESSKHDIQWKWVRGHSGVEYNEKADILAREAIKGIL